jgi:hypothetical protein
MLSTVLILPVDQVDTGNAVAEAMGWGPSNYSIPLSADGRDPVTHYGLHTWATEGFRDMIEAGYYPPELEQAGIDEKTFTAMTAVLVSSFWPDYTDHFATVTAENNLQIVEVPDEAE